MNCLGNKQNLCTCKCSKMDVCGRSGVNFVSFFRRRQQRLEEEHANVEYQIRCLMLTPEANKTDLDKAKEEELINRYNAAKLFLQTFLTVLFVF